ncbi:MAG: SIS domain-containing protein [Candidatus Latescibacterota bacterium]|nr:SIS domain-containing protein [Candidatus Latescibacterota bacterium]
MSAGTDYYDRTTALLQDLRETQMEAVDAAAQICTDSIATGGLVFLFGAGHSRMMCEEMTPRQGCFVGFFALVELAVSTHSSIVGTNSLRGPLHLEKYDGYAEEILKSFKFGPHDAMILISTSGIRPLIVEMAQGAKQRGMPVIALTAREHGENSPPAHSSGQKLIDIADVVLDNRAPSGDCVLGLEGLEWRTGPVSTITGAMLINMLRCEVAERLLARGIKPELLPSHQLVDNVSSEEQLERFYEGYRKSLAHLYQ